MTKSLKKLQSLLPHYFTYAKSNDTLIISEDKSVLPFAFIIDDKKKNLLLSLAIDYPFTDAAVNLALTANSIKPVLVVEKFFISKMGDTHFGDDADHHFIIEQELPLEDLIPLSKEQH